MMNCTDCQNLFSLYLDDEIDTTNRALLQSHLESCQQCEVEFQAFKNTVYFLQNFPKEQIPADFLVGIHAKLESQSAWEKAKGWLSWPGQRKIALSSAFGMLAIGFVTASLIQIIPGSQTENHKPGSPVVQTRQIAQTKTTQNNVLARNTILAKDSIQDFYPGIPLLSEYEGTTTQTFQHLSMNQYQSKEQRITPYYNMTASPVTYNTAPQPTTLRPDLQITIHHSANNEHIAMMRQIVQSSFWQAKIYDNHTLLLSVPAGNFEKLRKICCQINSSFSPAHAKHQRYLSPKRNLTVAVRLD